jgi:peptidyl-prolyl cis-trans isomerase SurA
MKRIVLFVLCIMGSFMLQGDVITADQEIVDGIVAVIGDEIVLLSELQRQIHDEMMRREMSLEKTPRNELLALREEVIQGMVENILLIEKARRDSIEVDMQEVDLELKNRIAEFKKQVGGEEAYLNALEEFGFTELQLRNKYREDIYKDFLRQRLVYTMRVHISVTPQDIEGWFAANKDSLPEVSEKYKVSHILIYPEISEEKKQAAREKIQGILEQIWDISREVITFQISPLWRIAFKRGKFRTLLKPSWVIIS